MLQIANPFNRFAVYFGTIDLVIVQRLFWRGGTLLTSKVCSEVQHIRVGVEALSGDNTSEILLAMQCGGHLSCLSEVGSGREWGEVATIHLTEMAMAVPYDNTSTTIHLTDGPCGRKWP